MSDSLEWAHTLDEVGENGLSRERRASDIERAALARALDIVAVPDLRVSYVIRPLGRGRYQLAGDIEAEVTQTCVVTLGPVPGRIAEHFEAEFMPQHELAHAERQEDEMEALAAADLEPIRHDRLEVGRVVYEQLAAALDPFPRKSGANLEHSESTPPEPAEETNPFAKLSKLRPKS